MHSYILSNFNQEKAVKKILAVTAVKLPSVKFREHPDIIHLEPAANPKLKSGKTSITIAQVRELRGLVNRSPLFLPVTIVVIWQADKATLPAQQALLKSIEEPSSNTVFFLITDRHLSLLPTILSRCQLIPASGSDSTKLPPSELEFSIRELYQKKPVERMVAISEYGANREVALEFLETLMRGVELKLDRTSPKGLGSLAVLLENAQMTYHNISANNVNPRLAVDNFAISWDNTMSALDDETA